MNERLIENWLTKVNEKSFQVPFCQLLIGEGFKVVHLSQHGPFEDGKDILAIAPDGTPCAFQLKSSTGKLSQKEFSKFYDQLVRLVESPIDHPSIDQEKERRVYLVLNGELSEEVRTQITKLNNDWRRRKHPELQTILLGELLPRFIRLHTNFWPSDLFQEKEFLELYFDNGAGYLNKPKFASFIEGIFIIRKKLSKNECVRILANAAIFTSYSLNPFIISNNHVAIIEGWIIYLSYAISFIEKNKLEERYWKNSLEIAEVTIEQSLKFLHKELCALNHFVAGNALVDSPFYRGRLTWLSSFISVLLFFEIKNNPEYIMDKWSEQFLLSNQKYLYLWGEAAIPQFLSIHWVLRIFGFSYMSDRLLFALFKGLIENSTVNNGVPDPYHSLGEIILSVSGLSDSLKNESFIGRSYSLDALTQLLTRRGFRGILEEYWRKLSHVYFIEFEPDFSWQYCLWHCDEGILYETSPNTPQSWELLVEHSKSFQLKKIPVFFQNNPFLLLLFLIVYPHRMNPDAIKLIDSYINEFIVNND